MYEYTAKYLYFGAAYLARSGYIMHAVIGDEPLQIVFAHMPPQPVPAHHKQLGHAPWPHHS